MFPLQKPDLTIFDIKIEFLVKTVYILARDGIYKVVIARLGTYKRTYKLANRTCKPSK